MRRLLLAATLVFLLPPVAHATDQTVLGKLLLVKGSDTPAKRKIVLKAKESGSDDSIVGDPLANGATLSVSAYGGTTSSDTLHPAEHLLERRRDEGLHVQGQPGRERPGQAAQDQEVGRRRLPDQGRHQRQARRRLGAAARRRHRRLRPALSRRRGLVQRPLRRRHDQEQGRQAVQGAESEHRGDLRSVRQRISRRRRAV